MNDHDISCETLTSPTPGIPAETEHPTNLIRLAQMSSVVTEKILNLESYPSTPEDWSNAISDLDAQYAELGRTLGDLVSVEIPLDNVELLPQMNLQTAAYLRLAYLVIGLDIHTTLACPWSQLRRHPAIQTQVQRSADIVAKISRAAMLATHHVRIEANTSTL